MPVSTPAANKLLHDGLKTLAAVETNGMRIDTDYLALTKQNITDQITELKNDLRKEPEYKVWQRTYGTKLNFNARAQLADVLFKKMGYKHSDAVDADETAKLSASASILSGVNTPFTRKYIKMEKLRVARDTFLAGIEDEVYNGFIYPNFNLHTTVTYRSSANDPNSQNWPVRDPEIAKLIRSCFIPRSRRRCIFEIDFSGIEVRVAACYHKDPTMMTYIEDESKDMHRDMAAQIYKLAPEHVSKMARYCAKNMYVFPEFYGSYWRKCAANLWDAMTKHELKGYNDIPMLEWLAKKGITELGDSGTGDPVPGTFEHHLMLVEKDFWGKRFPVYAEWKKTWWKKYLKNGGFRTLTGFYIEGVFQRNDVINYPVQGAAFHCLLWSLIEIVKKLKKYNFKTLITGQIHDSIIGDGPEREIPDVMEICHEIMTKKLRDHWTWINVPIEVEAEVSPAGESWYKKEAYKLAA